MHKQNVQSVGSIRYPADPQEDAHASCAWTHGDNVVEALGAATFVEDGEDAVKLVVGALVDSTVDE